MEGSLLERIVEFRGLSDFPLPGILDRSALNERDDSFVSDFPKEGYVWRLSERSVLGPAAAEPLEPPPLSFEFWFPIILVYVFRIAAARKCPSLVPRRRIPAKETSAQTPAVRDYVPYTGAG
jgi:hypothetical protein